MHMHDVFIQAHPWGVVGFYKRTYTRSAEAGFEYGRRTDNIYHSILTSAAFIHRNYLDLFDRHLEPTILAEIDQKMNCEDLAMNVLIGDLCRCTAAFYVALRHPVEGPRTRSHSSTGSSRTEFKRGLSSRPGHFIGRSRCLNSMAKYYVVRLAPNYCVVCVY